MSGSGENQMLTGDNCKLTCFLSAEDQEFFRIAYFGEISERDMAKSYGISQPAIHKRKKKILFDLKKLWEI